MMLDLDKSTWRRVMFGDVVRNVNEYFVAAADGALPYVAGPHIEPGEPTVVSYGSTDDDDFPPTFKRKFRDGDVLLHSRGIEKLAAVDRDGVTGEKLFVLRSKDEAVLRQRFLLWLLLSPEAQAHMQENFTGSVNKFLNWGSLAEFECDLPPVTEQERLAELMWALEQHRRQVEVVRRQLLGAHDRAQLAMLIHGIRTGWSTKPFPSDAVDSWTSGALPSGWSGQTIRSVGRVRAGGTPSRAEQARYFDGGRIPWVKTLDLNEGVLHVTDENITEVASSESPAKVIPAGTVLVAMYGGFGQIGRTAQLGVDAATNQAVSAVLDLSEDVLPEFLHEVLKAGRPKWRKVAASSRKDPNITKRDIENFDFPLPSRAEQEEIIHTLSTVKSAHVVAERELASLGAVRLSLLNEIFGGN